MVTTASRIWRTVAGGMPTTLAELYPRPIQILARPGATSAKVEAADASTDGCLVTGLVTADATFMDFVFINAWAIETNTSRSSIWESNKPTPSNPASSHLLTKSVISGRGLHGGTRRSILMAIDFSYGHKFWYE